MTTANSLIYVPDYRYRQSIYTFFQEVLFIQRHQEAHVFIMMPDDHVNCNPTRALFSLRKCAVFGGSFRIVSDHGRFIGTGIAKTGSACGERESRLFLEPGFNVSK